MLENRTDESSRGHQYRVYENKNDIFDQTFVKFSKKMSDFRFSWVVLAKIGTKT